MSPGKPLALTVGEPAGIGPDITIEAWLARGSADIAPFIFVGDGSVLSRRATALGREIAVAAATPGEAAAIFPDAIPCLAGESTLIGSPGGIARADTAGVIRSIRSAVELVHAGEAAAVVTNPIQKKALDAVGFGFPGHTEFLGALSEELYGRQVRPVMLLAKTVLRSLDAGSQL